MPRLIDNLGKNIWEKIIEQKRAFLFWNEKQTFVFFYFEMKFMIENIKKHAEHDELGQDEKVAQDEYEKFVKEAEQKRVTDFKSIADNMIKMNEELMDVKTTGKMTQTITKRMTKPKPNSEG